MEIVDVVARAFDRLLNAGLRVFLSAMNTLEQALRGPLQAAGIHGALQTLVLMLVPLVIIVAVVKLFGGVLRTLVLVVLILVLIHLSWPLIMAGQR